GRKGGRRVRRDRRDPGVHGRAGGSGRCDRPVDFQEARGMSTTIEVWIIAMAVFGAIACAGFYATRAGDAFLARYHQSFMEQARVNLADMFLFVDPAYLYSINIIVLIVVPAVLWLATGKLLIALVALVLLAIVPKKVYRWL